MRARACGVEDGLGVGGLAVEMCSGDVGDVVVRKLRGPRRVSGERASMNAA